MADIEFHCPECLNHLTVDSKGAGRAVNCPECSKEIRIPQSNPPEVTIRTSQKAESPGHRNCPFCGEQVLKVAKKCKHCGEFFDQNCSTHSAQPVAETNYQWAPGKILAVIITVVLTAVVLYYAISNGGLLRTAF
jgi:DNA-directed RNA polymerase subunit M/transcription elongation factor TFIIS